MVGKLTKDENGWCIIHEEAAGPYVWVSPYKLAPDQEFPQEWKEGDVIEFKLDTPSFDTITITDKNYQTAKIDIV